ncbi:MAG: FAD binding domain-containing protein [Planctomycetota bacterium]
MRDHLLIYLNGHPLRVSGDDAFLTLTDFLRKRRGLPGTKVVCAEGDCGSCAVLLGRPSASSNTVHYTNVTACIQLMLQLDGVHVVTIEGLTPASEQDLNPIQDAMVRCHGTQCGFCTPGFVVSLYQLLHEGQPHDTHTLRRGLTGNLCRCTGYDSIVQAAEQTDRERLTPLNTLYPPRVIAEALNRATAETVDLHTADGRRLFKPATLNDATAWLADQHAKGVSPTIISGGTDLGVLNNHRKLRPEIVLTTTALPELQDISVNQGMLSVGGAAPLSQLEDTAQTHLPELAEYLGWFGSPLIRNAGTLAGNLCTASPIGDTAPVLYALGATLELASTTGTRSMPVQDFHTGYRTTELRPDELLTRVDIPLPKRNEHVRFYKVSKRRDMDISTFSAAAWLRVTDRHIEDARLAFGGVGPRVLRMPEAEAELINRPFEYPSFERAADAARAAVRPLSDVRGSAGYRSTLAGNILHKLWHDLTHPGANDDENHNGKLPRSPKPAGDASAPVTVHHPSSETT